MVERTTSAATLTTPHAPVSAEAQAAIDVARLALPPWELPGWEPSPKPKYPPGELLQRMKAGLEPLPYRLIKVTPKREVIASMKKLKAARTKLLQLSEVVTDEAFDYWVNRYVLTAERPDEWTQASLLYESYLKHAKEFGNNRPDKALAKLTLATETRWGKMMGSQFMKKRRKAGWYYPLRLKQGA